MKLEVLRFSSQKDSTNVFYLMLQKVENFYAILLKMNTVMKK